MKTRSHLITVLAALAIAAPLAAQDEAPRYTSRFNFATYAGASIPTGDLRNSFDNGFLLGAQSTYDLGTHLGLLGSFDWTHPTTKLVTTDAHANVYQANLGLELGGARSSAARWALRPFVDLGGGVRRYTFSSSALTDRTRGVAFGAAGTELTVGRTALRVAASDNVFSYEASTPDATRATRNDVGLSIGIGFHP